MRVPPKNTAKEITELQHPPLRTPGCFRDHPLSSAIARVNPPAQPVLTQASKLSTMALMRGAQCERSQRGHGWQCSGTSHGAWTRRGMRGRVRTTLHDKNRYYT